MRIPLLLGGLSVALLASLPVASAMAVPDGGVELVSRPTGFGPLPFDGVGYAGNGAHSMSLDGCKIVFESESDVLSDLDDDTVTNVYRVDRCAPGRPVALVSRTAGGAAADGGSYQATISADGTRVAFLTSARNLLPAGTAVPQSVVVKDLSTGSVTLAGRAHGSDGLPAEAYSAVISGDGNAVGFVGVGPIDANNADGGDAPDVYVRFLDGLQTVMVSARAGAPAGAAEFDISDTGRRVALMTYARLTPADIDTGPDAYLASVAASGTVTHRLVSTDDAAPSEVALAGDGALVAYADAQVWVADCAAGPCSAPAAAAGGSGQAIYGLGFPRAAGGRPGHVFWTTNGALLPEDTNNRYDLYVASLPPGTGLTLPLGVLPGGTDMGDVTDDLGVAAVSTQSGQLPGGDGAHPQVFARADGQTTLLSQPADRPPRRLETDHSSAGRGAVSENGRWVVMTTESPALGAAPRPGGGAPPEQIVARDVERGILRLVSSDPDGRPADGDSTDPSIDAAGSIVAFESTAVNLVPGTPAGRIHVYVRDLATGRMRLVDRAPDGAPAGGGAERPDLSGDGRTVAFLSASTGLPGANGYTHAYVADLVSGSVVLVDRAPDGTAPQADVRDVVLDADGSRAAFISSAVDLGTADAGAKVFLKDLATGAITYVSVPQAATAQAAQQLSIDDSGRHVGWTERAATFGYGSDGRRRVFVRDVERGVTTIASGAVPQAEELDGELDGDGSHLAFIRREGDVSRPYLRDLRTGATVDLLPGRRRGADGVGLSRDGRCAALTSHSPDVIRDNPSPDFGQVYLRAVGGPCAETPTAPSPGGGTTTGRDVTRPTISRLRALRVRRGARVTFRLSERARTTVTIARCVARRGARCRRYRVVARTTRAHARPGRNRLTRQGLRRGRYRITVGAVDGAGNRALPRRARLHV